MLNTSSLVTGQEVSGKPYIQSKVTWSYGNGSATEYKPNLLGYS